MKICRKPALFLYSFFILALNSCSAGEVRKPAVAGSFYPEDPKTLSQNVKEFLGKAKPQPVEGEIFAIMVPHAGYIFSGQTAAYAYKLIENIKFDTYILIGLSHRFPVEGAAVVSSGFFETPLGKVKIDSSLAKKLIDASPLIKDLPAAHAEEHSLEVQLPFLQTISKDFKILPLLMGNPSLEVCKEIGIAIAQAAMDSNTLLVCSADMSHYLNYRTANEIDNITTRTILRFDPISLYKKIRELENAKIPNLACVICAEGAVLATMYAARSLGAGKITALKYSNSGDVSLRKDSVVGYLSAVFTETENRNEPANDSKEAQMDKIDFKISEKNQEILLKLARKSIALKSAEKGIKELKIVPDEELSSQAAVFVTLNKSGSLRGCIGTVSPQSSLLEAVAEMAVSSAYSDHRFPPVTKQELDGIHIEISVLSPLQKASSHNEIKENVHGVVVKKGFRSGLFLPQVWEHFPNDKDSFMGELCSQKAGLPRDAWKTNEVELYTFTVFSFEEK